MGLNNIILGIYLVWTMVEGLINKEKRNWKNLKKYTPVFSFFILALIASVNNTNTFFLKNLESYWSFLLLPLAFWLQQGNQKEQLKYALNGLVFGCVITLIICYINAFYEIIVYNEPISYFLRWRHLGHEFTQIADTHPAYLGLFICLSTYYLLFENNYFNKQIKIIILLVFSLGMFQLVSRMALFIYILVFVLYFILKIVKLKKGKVFFLILIALITSLIFSFGSDYLRNRIFSSESYAKDSRFERLKVSYELFKEHPLIGIGFDKIDEKRIDKYSKYGYNLAAKKKYNTHNQFLEYLSINGFLGGVTYLGVFIFLIVYAIREKEYLFLFILVTFFLANITESMLVRIKGIEFFTLYTCIFLGSVKIKSGLYN
jgi:O-antigen ligase